MLKFIYGTMGSSKTAQALIKKFEYSQNEFQVLLMKPSIANREENIESRIGLKSKCLTFDSKEDLKYKCLSILKSCKSIIIIDECQFCTKIQINQLKEVSRLFDVFCYGLKVNLKSELFPGSKRLLELADDFQCLDSICKCGEKAILNLLFNKNGKLIKRERDIKSLKEITHQSVCYDCWKRYMLNKGR